MSISLGAYAKGETPGRLTYAFLNAAGAPLNIGGFSVQASIELPDLTFATVAGQVDNSSEGLVSIPWTEAMTANAGQHSIVIWAGDGAATKYASAVIYYTVADDQTPTFS